MRAVVLALVAAALAACSADQPIANTSMSESSGGEVALQAAAAPADQLQRSQATSEGSESAPDQSATTPGFYIAYSYQLGFRLPGRRLAAVMDAQAQACTDAGPAVCQVINANREGDPNDYLSGSLVLRAEPGWLQTFMAQAESGVGEAGGEVRSRTTSAEDVTREMVDTEARLAALRTLRDRLQEILRSRPGLVADLLEVERELARVQGELDAAASALAVLRQRVDMSVLTISYEMADQAVTPRTFEPIGEAASGFLWMLSSAVGAIITLIAVALPWGLFIAAVIWALRYFKVGRGWRWPWGKRGAAEQPQDQA
jgi:opacity protein-like surface antigen